MTEMHEYKARIARAYLASFRARFPDEVPSSQARLEGTPTRYTDHEETEMLPHHNADDNGTAVQDTMMDVYGDPEARKELATQKELMQKPPFNTPPSKLDSAFTIAADGRVTIDGDTITVKGSKNDTYTIVSDRCNCGHATAGGKQPALKHSCPHAVAATLHQRTQQALAGLAAPSLFALPPATHQPAQAHMGVHEHGCPTCGRVWECSVLCGTLSLEKECPTCSAMREPLPDMPVEVERFAVEPLSPPSATPEPTLRAEDIARLRKDIVTHLFALGCKAGTKQEYEDATMTYVGLVLAPENYALIVERLRELLEARATLPAPRKPLSESVVQVHGQNHIKFSGLLDAAHYQGLASLCATFISVTDTLALATATATFKDGRTFTESADATPSNVTPQIKPHFARMALTRAKARCLRDALNIDALAEEELGG
jgi:hypothetical protein